MVLPQALYHMLNARSSVGDSIFGIITNGREYNFIKVKRTAPSWYSRSRFYAISNPGNELYDVLRVLRRFAEIVSIAPGAAV